MIEVDDRGGGDDDGDGVVARSVTSEVANQHNGYQPVRHSRVCLHVVDRKSFGELLLTPPSTQATVDSPCLCRFMLLPRMCGMRGAVVYQESCYGAE